MNVGAALAMAGMMGEPRSVSHTYATWSTTDKSSAITISNANLTATATSTTKNLGRANKSESSGKWYWEITVNNANAALSVGFTTSASATNIILGSDAYGWGWNGAAILHNNANVLTVPSYATGDVLGIALDLGAGSVTFYKNGSSVGTVSSISGTLFPAWSRSGTSSSTGQVTANFGASAFTYSVPSGFNSGVY
jgi:hypothetical protein